MNEHLLQTIDSIEETIVESELSVLASIGNQYAKVALITEYADEDVVNEFDIIQESVIMEAKKDKKTDNNDGKSKEGIIAKLKRAWNVVKGFFISIGRWFKTKFTNFINKFKKNKQADPQTEKEIKSCQAEVNSISKTTSVEELKKINDHVKKLRGKFGDLKTVKRPKKDSSDKLQDEKNEMSIDEIDKLIDDTDDMFDDFDLDDEESKKIDEELEKADKEEKERVSSKQTAVLNKIAHNLREITEGLYLTYKHNLSEDAYSKLRFYDQYGGKDGEEVKKEFAKYNSASIDRVKKHMVEDPSKFSGINFIMVSAYFRGAIRDIAYSIDYPHIDDIEKSLNELKKPDFKLYFPFGPKEIEENNNDIDKLMDKINPSFKFVKYEAYGEYEKCADLIQNELAPFVSQAVADMLSYNMSLMKAYEEVAKRHGLIK
jgi:hypothetical protein